MTTTATHAGFLQDIIEHPADDTPRLIYADWLEEHGEEERAEFIRVQCRIAHLDMGGGQLPMGVDRKTLQRHERHWIEENRHSIQEQFRPLTVGLLRQYQPGQFDPEGNVLFSRGFIAEVRCPLALWLQHGPQIAAAHPVEVVRLTDREPRLIVDDYDLFRSPEAAHAWASERAIAWARKQALIP